MPSHQYSSKEYLKIHACRNPRLADITIGIIFCEHGVFKVVVMLLHVLQLKNLFKISLLIMISLLSRSVEEF